jgi:hypothetical protein
MGSTAAKGDIIRILCCLSDTLVYMSCVNLRCGHKPWVVAFLTVFAIILCLRTSFDVVVGLWIYPIHYLSLAMKNLYRSKYSLRRPATMQDSSKAFLAVPTLRYILQELVHIPAVLLSTGISFLRVWLERNRLELPLLQLPCSVLRLSLTLCFVQLASIETQVLRRSVEFSYDQEAQDTAGGWRCLKDPWIGLGFRIPFEAAQTKKTQ